MGIGGRHEGRQIGRDVGRIAGRDVGPIAGRQAGGDGGDGRDPDRDRWDRLVKLLAPIHDAARATARRLARSFADGDDLFQEACLRAHAALPSLRDEARFRSWFYAVLLSVHRSRARRAFWSRFLSLDREREHGFDAAGEDGGRWEEQRQRAERASRALATLPAVQREAVVLFEIEGFSIEEIAEMQKTSIPAVKARLQRGRARIRRFYERLGMGSPGMGSSPACLRVVEQPRLTRFGDILRLPRIGDEPRPRTARLAWRSRPGVTKGGAP